MSGRLLERALRARERVAALRRELPADAAGVLTDAKLESFIAFQLLLLVQDVVDLAVRLVADRGLGVPTSQREAFELLAKAGLITPELATALGGMAALRNRIARAYGDLDPVRMTREAPTGLATVKRFLDAITPHVAGP